MALVAARARPGSPSRPNRTPPARRSPRNESALPGGRARLLASTALIGGAVDYFHWHETISWVVVMGVITVANYTLSKLWVFAARK